MLQSGAVHHIERSTWSLRLLGLVGRSLTMSLDDLVAMPAVEQVSDIHCVTGWSKLETRWKGVRAVDLLEMCGVLPEARHAMVHAVAGWTTNLPLEELLHADVLVAYEYEGAPISDEHGGPVRLLVPRLYFWKSAKWMTAIELTRDERLGYWESVGYHALGDPWLEQRYS